MSFLGIFQKSAGIFKFLKIFDDKKAVFRSTFKFPPENEVVILFSTNSIQLELPVFEFFGNFA